MTPSKVLLRSEYFHHVENLICQIDSKHYRCIFLYKNDNPGIISKFSFEISNVISGIILYNNFTFEGFLVLLNETIEECNCIFIGDKNNFSLYDELIKFAKIDYPNHPYTQLKNYLEYAEINMTELPNISTSDIPFDLQILKFFKIYKKKTNEDMVNFIQFWKEYSYKRMNSILSSSNFYDKISISSCIYLSTRILRENILFDWNWKYVTANNAISNRDILANPNLPWDEDELIGRNLPEYFYLYKQIEITSENKDVREDSLLEKLMTPENFDYSSTIEFITLIEEKYKLLKSLHPQFFDLNKTYNDLIKQEIIHFLHENKNNDFNKFEFPKYCHFDDDNDNYEDVNDYEGKKPNTYFNNIKTREEYLKLLKRDQQFPFSTNYSDCEFFRVEDIDQYPKCFKFNLFGTLIKKCGFSIDDIFKKYPDFQISIFDLLNNFPVDYLWNNVVFWMDRIKIVPYKLEENETIDQFHERLLKEDKKIQNFFLMIKECKKYKYHYFSSFEKNIKYPRHFDKYADFSFVNWDSLKTSQGIDFLNEFLIEPIDKENFIVMTDSHKDKLLVSLFGNNKIIKEKLSDTIPNSLIINNSHIRWYAPSTINIYNVLSEYNLVFDNCFPAFLILNSINDIESNYFKLIQFYISSLIKQKIDEGLPKNLIYELCIESIAFFVNIVTINNTSFLNTLRFILNENFNNQDMNNSKYAHFEIIIENLLKQ